MNGYSLAQNAYGQTSAPIRTDRDTEYTAFARVTHQLKEVDETDRSRFPALAEAVQMNARLWSTLFEDLMQDGNGLPEALRAQIISLALFVQRHTHAVLSGRGSVDVLIEINAAIMKGLRGRGTDA